jgi:hypothetical protein
MCLKIASPHCVRDIIARITIHKKKAPSHRRGGQDGRGSHRAATYRDEPAQGRASAKSRFGLTAMVAQLPGPTRQSGGRSGQQDLNLRQPVDSAHYRSDIFGIGKSKTSNPKGSVLTAILKQRRSNSASYPPPDRPLLAHLQGPIRLYRVRRWPPDRAHVRGSPRASRATLVLVDHSLR